AFAMQPEIVSTSLRHGIKIVSSSPDVVDRSDGRSRFNTSVMIVCDEAARILRQELNPGNLHIGGENGKTYVGFVTDMCPPWQAFTPTLNTMSPRPAACRSALRRISDARCSDGSCWIRGLRPKTAFLTSASRQIAATRRRTTWRLGIRIKPW